MVFKETNVKHKITLHRYAIMGLRVINMFLWSFEILACNISITLMVEKKRITVSYFPSYFDALKKTEYIIDLPEVYS